MNLSAVITPETRSLIETVCDGLADDAQVRDLESLLLADEKARKFYVYVLDLDAKLQRFAVSRQGSNAALTEFIAIRQSTQGSSAHTSPAIFPTSLFPSTLGDSSAWTISYLSGAVITGLLIFAFWLMPASDPKQVAKSVLPSVPVVAEPKAYVGRITGMVDCKWNEGLGIGDWRLEKRTGKRVALDDKLAITSGLLEITYKSGAKVLLQGPVTYTVETNGGYLSIGKLTGKLEKQGSGIRDQGSGTANQKSKIKNQKSSLVTDHRPLTTSSNPQSLIPNPFVIHTPTATVTDLGTEFGVEVAKDGDTETEVFTGSVHVLATTTGARGENERIVQAGNTVLVRGNGNPFVAMKSTAGKFIRTTSLATKDIAADNYAKLVLSMNPFAYYRMENPAGRQSTQNSKESLVLVDSAPGGHHGRVHLENPSGGGAWDAGQFGGALRLGGGNYALVENLVTTDTNQLAVATWVYGWCRDSDSFYTIACRQDLASNDRPGTWFVGMHFGTLMAQVFQSDGGDIRASRDGLADLFSCGRWQHVAFVADGAFLRLYCNGVEVATARCNGVQKAPPIRHLTIGVTDVSVKTTSPVAVVPYGQWAGRIDEFVIFHHAITAEQVRQLATRTSSLSGKAFQATPKDGPVTQ